MIFMLMLNTAAAFPSTALAKAGISPSADVAALAVPRAYL